MRPRAGAGPSRRRSASQARCSVQTRQGAGGQGLGDPAPSPRAGVRLLGPVSPPGKSLSGDFCWGERTPSEGSPRVPGPSERQSVLALGTPRSPMPPTLTALPSPICKHSPVRHEEASGYANAEPQSSCGTPARDKNRAELGNGVSFDGEPPTPNPAFICPLFILLITQQHQDSGLQPGQQHHL